MKTLKIKALAIFRLFENTRFTAHLIICRHPFFKVPRFLVQNWECIEMLFSNSKMLNDVLNLI